jgi:hypothetical protein
VQRGARAAREVERDERDVVATVDLEPATPAASTPSAPTSTCVPLFGGFWMRSRSAAVSIVYSVVVAAPWTEFVYAAPASPDAPLIAAVGGGRAGRDVGHAQVLPVSLTIRSATGPVGLKSMPNDAPTQRLAQRHRLLRGAAQRIERVELALAGVVRERVQDARRRPARRCRRSARSGAIPLIGAAVHAWPARRG